MFADPSSGFIGQGGRASAIQTGTKLYISNLDYGVSNEDIKVFILLVDEWSEKRFPFLFAFVDSLRVCRSFFLKSVI